MIIHNSYCGTQKFEDDTIQDLSLTLVEDMGKFFVIKHVHTAGENDESTNVYTHGLSVVRSPLEAHRLFEEIIEDYRQRGFC